MISLKCVVDEGTDNELVGWTGYLSKYRINDQNQFELKFVQDNLYTRKGGDTQALADGFWIFVKENVFASGSEHTIEIESIGEYYS